MVIVSLEGRIGVAAVAAALLVAGLQRLHLAHLERV
jgi:hypothetical protein